MTGPNPDGEIARLFLKAVDDRAAAASRLPVEELTTARILADRVRSEHQTGMAVAYALLACAGELAAIRAALTSDTPKEGVTRAR